MIDEHINKIDKIDLAACTMTFCEEGIIHIDFKKIEELTVKDVKEMMDVFGQKSEGKKHPILITVKQFMTIDKDVRELWAEQGRSQYSSADAIVATHVAIKMIANFYIAVNKPAIPTRVFNFEQEAIDWLKTFL